MTTTPPPRPMVAEAMKHTDAARTAVLKWFAALALALPAEVLVPLLPPVARMCHRITNSPEPPHRLAPEVRALAAEAADIFTQTVGGDVFAAALHQERSRAVTTRLARKSEAALVKVLDPARAADDRRKRNAAKSRQRVRKLVEARQASDRPLAASSHKHALLAKGRRAGGGAGGGAGGAWRRQ
jgi:hypothetical protein